ncbi:hypothetical protein Amal_03709 [Acetobacter malorum]|uniref:Uncharacterized protein n=1 Tax=Acetobacter malorum TaxID=178901 RepID=A0A177G462_9PROT|nr:hypothetical protein Amal_03709 [Acetobacter malorum]
MGCMIGNDFSLLQEVREGHAGFVCRCGQNRILQFSKRSEKGTLLFGELQPYAVFKRNFHNGDCDGVGKACTPVMEVRFLCKPFAAGAGNGYEMPGEIAAIHRRNVEGVQWLQSFRIIPVV